jgi:hypothetical protein
VGLEQGRRCHGRAVSVQTAADDIALGQYSFEM